MAEHLGIKDLTRVCCVILVKTNLKTYFLLRSYTSHAELPEFICILVYVGKGSCSH